ncbi:hypothetical protein I6G82_00550 [Lysinibacillus macroides]|uniref:Uncharacterized protein n=1 Tax=Lysinibacillus macroides TaxID=33935 RepID=A0A0M9DJN0_9BACI|nr:hypothetical protein [Lysinibacillus macroides]KOY82219.1 hypothetical protein ADM90_11310 [Lysinibacillus macroides]QPR68200.1 hypothetical protein I6G82_00550 [Lysinibacillus macroides]
MTSFMMLFLFMLLVITFLLSKFSRITQKFWSPRKIIIGITGYLLLGLCAFLYVSFFAESPIQVLSGTDLKTIEKNSHTIQAYDQEYNASYLTEDHLRKTWEFDFQGTELPVISDNNTPGFHFNVRYRYNDDMPAGKALVSYYQFQDIVDGIDISAEIPLPHLYMEQNELVIQALPEHRVQYYRAKASFMLLDFHRYHEQGGYTLFAPSSNVIVIDISPHTTLEDRQGLIQYLQ